MADAQIEVEIGQFRFSGQGEQQWLAQQMDKIIKSAEALMKLAPPPAVVVDKGMNGGTGGGAPGERGTLKSFLDRTKARGSKVNLFLGAAQWSHLGGQERLTPGEVNTAITSNSQGSLANPSDCLSKNLKKGYCARDGKQFYVTEEGRKHLKL